ncbi:hypothetical protein BK025_08335 [Sodalis sp. TME1]|nr:hypothetical protein BK025_08335 [Sodalis sp. TME1]
MLCMTSASAAAPLAKESQIVLRVGVASRLGQDLWFKASGEDQHLPYTVQWVNFDAAPPAMDALLADSIDTFWGGDTPAVFLAYNQRDAKVVAASEKGLFGALLVAKDSPITTVEQLKGKKIAVYRGSGFHNSLLSILQDHGLSADDVQLSYLAPAEGLAALTQGRVAAWGIWDPNAAIAEKTFGARILATPRTFSLGLQFASQKTLADKGKSQALQDFLLRSYRATAWLRAHPQRWAELQAKEANISPDVARLAASRVGGQFVPIDAGLEKAVQTIADNFYRLGIIDHATDVSPVFDARYTTFLQQRLQEKK